MNTKEATNMITALFDDFRASEPEGDFARKLYKIEGALEVAYKASLLDDVDKRSGEETYGVVGNYSWMVDMLYISDRWNCSFRIRWMLDMITHLKTLYKES